MRTFRHGEMDDTTLMSMQEAAALLGVSRQTVRREIAAKKLRAFRIRNRWRLLPSDIEAYKNRAIEERESGNG